MVVLASCCACGVVISPRPRIGPPLYVTLSPPSPGLVPSLPGSPLVLRLLVAALVVRGWSVWLAVFPPSLPLPGAPCAWGGLPSVKRAWRTGF